MKKVRGMEERRRFWEQHLSEWKSSGLSAAEYCRRNKVSPKSFFYWKRRQKAVSELPCLVEVPVQSQAAVSIIFSSTPVRLLVGSGYRIEIEKNFDADALDRLITFLDKR
jgi:hypothetical protein